MSSTGVTRFVAREGREPWQNVAVCGPLVDDEGRLCDDYGQPYPEEVQRLRRNMLPTVDMSVDLMIRDAVASAISWERRKPVYYSCNHCRDGKDLPEGYECQRCGADNPRNT